MDIQAVADIVHKKPVCYTYMDFVFVYLYNVCMYGNVCMVMYTFNINDAVLLIYTIGYNSCCGQHFYDSLFPS